MTLKIKYENTELQTNQKFVKGLTKTDVDILYKNIYTESILSKKCLAIKKFGKGAYMKKEKINTVCSTWKNNKKFPSITLVGNWLQELGFSSGAKFKVISCNDIIMLIKTKNDN